MKPTGKKDRLTAVLALGADEKMPVEGCLGDEEFALLLESKLPDRQQKLCMDHLARCDSCYGQWKIVKETQISQKRNNIIPIITARSYKYIGSTLAVAATLALFLNVYEPDVTQMPAMDKDDTVSNSQILPEATEVLEDSGSGVSAMDSSEVLEQKSGAPEPLNYMQKSKLRGKAESSNIEAPAALAPSMEDELQSRRSAPVKSSSVRKAARKEIPLEGDIFRLIKSGCEQPTYDATYWDRVVHVERLAGEGSKVSLSEDNVVRLMELIDDMDGANWQHYCDEMLGLLAEEYKSR
ncbi:hypothetical protein [Desulforhopalus sp. 52FAK]